MSDYEFDHIDSDSDDSQLEAKDSIWTANGVITRQGLCCQGCDIVKKLDEFADLKYEHASCVIVCWSCAEKWRNSTTILGKLLSTKQVEWPKSVERFCAQEPPV